MCLTWQKVTDWQQQHAWLQNLFIVTARHSLAKVSPSHYTLLQLHALQCPADDQSKVLCHSNPTFLGPFQHCLLLGYFVK